MKYRTKLWASISVATLLAASGAASGLLAHPATEAGYFLMASAGEATDFELSADDPLVYLSELDLVRAHYLAGEALLDIEGGREIAAEAFAHPIFEGYMDFEPILEARGGAPFMDEMTTAINLALGDAPVAEVRAAVGKVYAALDAAEKTAPEGDKNLLQTEAALTALMLDRAAKQYQMALAPGGSEEAWVDGYGIWKAAERRSGALVPKLEGAPEELAVELAAARKIFDTAYKSAAKPEVAEVDASALLAASARVSLRANSF